MTRALLGLAVGAVVVAGGLPGTARADRLSALSATLDPDAPIALRVDFDQWERAVDGYRQSGLPGAAQAVFFASAGSAALLGFDPLVTSGWFRAGFDGSAMVLASVGAIDRPAADGYTRGSGAPPLWRTRIALPVDDPAEAAAALKKLGKLPGAASIDDAAGVEAVVGGARGSGASIVASLRGFDVMAVAALPAGLGVAFLRKGSAVAVIDVLQPFGHPRMEWKRDARAVLAALGQRRSGIAAKMRSGAGTSLGDEGLTAWLDPTGVYDLTVLLERDDMLRAGLTPPARPPVCAQFRELITGGAFEDLSLSMHLTAAKNRGARKNNARLMSRYGLRGVYKLAGNLLVENDGLGSVETTLSSSTAAGASYLRTVEPLRTLPRPALLRGPRRDLRAALAACGAGGYLALHVFGWPQHLGMFLDDVAGVDPDAAVLVASLRNGLAVVDADVTPSGAVWRYGAEASFDPRAKPLLDKYLDLVFAARREVTTSIVPYTVWSQGPLKPFSRPFGKTVVFGISNHSHFTERLVRRAGDSSVGTKRLIAEALIRPARLIKALAVDDPLAQLVRPLVMRFDTIAIRVHLGTGVLESVATAGYH